MTITLEPGKDFFTDVEVTQVLGISLERLNNLLDQNIFHDGTQRPARLYFRPADVVLIEFWHRNSQSQNVLKMPRRS